MPEQTVTDRDRDRDAIELDATTLPHHRDAKDAQRCPKCQSRR